MLTRLMPGGARTIDGSTYDEGHANVLIHPQSTLTIKALAICLSDIQAKHGLTVQCLRAFCALLQQCFPTIKLPSMSPTGSNPFRHYVHNDTMVEVHVCRNGCLAYVGESIDRYASLRSGPAIYDVTPLRFVLMLFPCKQQLLEVQYATVLVPE